MADRPIIFSAPLVRALLDGRKTQTRRRLKPMRGVRIEEFQEKGPHPSGIGTVFECPRDKLRAPYASGDRLWMREAHAFVGSCDPGLLVTRADYPHCVPGHYENVPPASDIRWRPSIYMPRWASRLTLIVSDVRVQRVQDISEEDAQAEGGEPVLVPPDAAFTPYTERFRDMWDAIHGPDAWAQNPWVAAISFAVERRNIDKETHDA